MEEEQLLREQVAYYRARASEYDRWFLREGRYDRGSEHRAAWFAEVAEVEAALHAALGEAALGEKEVLELACGTGLWTRHLARDNTRVVAIDASPEAIAINRERLRSDKVDYRVADIFSWMSSETFDVVFFSFWLSHVPAARFSDFWALVRKAVKPHGQAFFVDSLLQQASTARDHGPLDDSGIDRRRLDDGREFEIVKVFYTPAELERRLREAGWRGWVRSSGQFFLYGSVTPVQGAG